MTIGSDNPVKLPPSPALTDPATTTIEAERSGKPAGNGEALRPGDGDGFHGRAPGKTVTTAGVNPGVSLGAAPGAGGTSAVDPKRITLDPSQIPEAPDSPEGRIAAKAWDKTRPRKIRMHPELYGSRAGEQPSALKDVLGNVFGPGSKSRNFCFETDGFSDKSFVNNPGALRLEEGYLKPEHFEQNTCDCYFVAALHAVAQSHPGLLESLVADNGDGTYTVTFPGGGPHRETITAALPSSYNRISGDVVGDNGQPMMVAELIEKAYAKWSGSYDQLTWGNSGVAMRMLTGESSAIKVLSRDQSDRLYNRMEKHLETGRPTVALCIDIWAAVDEALCDIGDDKEDEWEERLRGRLEENGVTGSELNQRVRDAVNERRQRRGEKIDKKETRLDERQARREERSGEEARYVARGDTRWERMADRHEHDGENDYTGFTDQHCYSIRGLSERDGVKYVSVRDPRYPTREKEVTWDEFVSGMAVLFIGRDRGEVWSRQLEE